MPSPANNTPKRAPRQSRCSANSRKPAVIEAPVLTSRELNELFMAEGLSERYFREQARFADAYRKAQAAS